MLVYIIHFLFLFGMGCLASANVRRMFVFFMLAMIMIVVAVTSGGGSDAVRYFEIGPMDVEAFLDHSSVFPLFKFFMYFAVEEPYGIEWRSWYSMVLLLPFLIVNALVSQRTQNNFFMATVLFFGTAFGFGMVYGEVRQSLSVSFGISGLLILLDNKYLTRRVIYNYRFFLGNAMFSIAAMFHIAGALFPLLYYVTRKNLRRHDWRNTFLFGVIFISLLGWFFWENPYLKQLVFHFVSDGIVFPGPGQAHIFAISVIYYVSFYCTTIVKCLYDDIFWVLIVLSFMPVFGYTSARLSFVLLLFFVINNSVNLMRVRTVSAVRFQGFMIACLLWTLLTFILYYYKDGLSAFSSLMF